MVDRTNKPMEWKREETDEAAGGALEATGVYETATGVVLYDSEEPLAWVQADNAVKLDEIA